MKEVFANYSESNLFSLGILLIGDKAGASEIGWYSALVRSFLSCVWYEIRPYRASWSLQYSDLPSGQVSPYLKGLYFGFWQNQWQFLRHQSTNLNEDTLTLRVELYLKMGSTALLRFSQVWKCVPHMQLVLLKTRLVLWNPEMTWEPASWTIGWA